MTAPKPHNAKVAEATAKLKDSQRALTDFRRQLLEHGHIPVKNVEAFYLRLVFILRKHILDLPAQILRDLKRAHPVMFAERVTAVAIEDTIEKAVDTLLSQIADEQWAMPEPDVPIIKSVPYSTKPTGRPKRPKAARPEATAP
jgi:hypothetical protein